MTTPQDPDAQGQQHELPVAPPPPEQHPQAPPPSDRELAPKAVRPREVEIAFTLSVISALSALLSLIGLFGGRQQIVQAGLEVARQQQQGLTPEQQAAFAESAANVTIILGAVVVVGFVGLFLLFAFKMRAGRNWARIVLAVFGILGLLGVVSDPWAPATLISLGLTVGAVVLMFLPASNNYFAGQKR